MQIAAIRVFTNDLRQARRFYEGRLGLRRIFGAENPDQPGPLGYDGGSVDLIIEDGRDEPGLVGRFTGLSFKVDDIDAEVARLQGRGVEFLGSPKAETWGGKLAHFRDDSGNVLTLVQYEG